MSAGDIAFMTYDLGELPLYPLPCLSPLAPTPHSADNMNTSFFDIDVIASVLRLHDLCDLGKSRSAKGTVSDGSSMDGGEVPEGLPRRRSTEPEVFIFPPPQHLLDNCCESSLNLSDITTETPSTSFASSNSASLASTISSSAVSSHVCSLSLASSTSSSSSGSPVTSARSIVASEPIGFTGYGGHIASPGVFSPICVSTPHYTLPITAPTQARPFSAKRVSPYERPVLHRCGPMTASRDVTTPNFSVLDNASMIANPSTCSLSDSCASTDTSSLSTDTSLTLSSLAHAPSTRQWERLGAEFHHCPYPTRKDKNRLADTLGMRVSDITRWFKNARRRYRCAMRRETRL